MSEAEQSELARLTVELLSAFVANNTVASGELPALIEATRAALAGDAKSPVDPVLVYTPAVSVEDSLASREHIVSLIDGKPYKTLKRHLTNNGLTPEQYKARYNLPADYPLVAPSYSEKRSNFAKTMGLGGKAAAGSAVAKSANPVKKVPKKADPIAAILPAATLAAKAPSNKQPAAKSGTVRAKGTPTTKSAAAPQLTKQAVPSEIAAAAAKPAAKPAQKLALLKGLTAEATLGPISDAVAAPKTAKPKAGSTATASATVEATPPSAGKPTANAKASPARKMAHPKSDGVTANTSEAAVTEAPASAQPKPRKKLSVKFAAVSETPSGTGASAASKPKVARKARSSAKSTKASPVAAAGPAKAAEALTSDS